MVPPGDPKSDAIVVFGLFFLLLIIPLFIAIAANSL